MKNLRFGETRRQAISQTETIHDNLKATLDVAGGKGKHRTRKMNNYKMKIAI